MNTENAKRSAMIHEEKNRLLFLEQKKTLDLFLETGAISQAQHDKSLHDLTVKMGMAEEIQGVSTDEQYSDSEKGNHRD